MAVLIHLSRPRKGNKSGNKPLKEQPLFKDLCSQLYLGTECSKSPRFVLVVCLPLPGSHRMIVLLQSCGTNTDGRVACLKTVVPFFFVSVKKKEKLISS
jgi:hypothetical protein